MSRSGVLVVAPLAYAMSLASLCAPAMANDAMFPAQTAAANSIGWQNNYFVVKGKPTIISAGEIHYARVPRELWRERLVKMKRAGFNAVSTYVFWNAQEPAPGVFEMGDNLDLDAWLTTIEDGRERNKAGGGLREMDRQRDPCLRGGQCSRQANRRHEDVLRSPWSFR